MSDENTLRVHSAWPPAALPPCPRALVDVDHRTGITFVSRRERALLGCDWWSVAPEEGSLALIGVRRVRELRLGDLGGGVVLHDGGAGTPRLEAVVVCC